MRSRRDFLKFGAAFSAVAVVGWQVWGRRPRAVDVEGGVGRRALTAPQFATLAAACAAFLEDPAAGRAAALGIDGYLADAGRDQAPDMALALTVLEMLPGGPARPTRFSRLAPDAQFAVLRSWERSGWVVRRQIAAALRKGARFTHFCRPDTWDAMGYEGPWVGREPAGTSP